MVSVNLKKIKFAPLLCALVILVSCLPVLPVAASAAVEPNAVLTVSGFWRFNETVSRVASLISQNVNFDCAGVSYANMSVYPGSLVYQADLYASSGLVVTIPGQTTLSFKSPDYRLIYFGSTDQVVSSEFMSWLNANASPIAQTFPFEGSWQFDLDITPSPDLYLDVSFSIFGSDTEYSSIYFDGDSLVFDGSSDALVPWTRSSGWKDDDFRVIEVFDTWQLDAATWSWLQCNAVQMRDPATSGYLETIVTIDDDESFLFTRDEFGSPDVTLSVTSTGAVLSCGDYRVKTWTYTGEGVFSGLYSGDGETLLPGNTIVLAGASGRPRAYQYYSAFADDPGPGPDPDAMTATFIVGSQIYIFAGTATTLPDVTMDVLAGGIRLSSGSTSYFYEFPSGCYGVRLLPNAESYVGVGETFVFYSDYSVDSYAQELYLVYDDDITYSSTVTFYHDDGTFWKRFTFSNTGSPPVVTLQVFSNSVAVQSGDQVYSFPVLGRDIAGLSDPLAPSVLLYFPGQTYTLDASSGAYEFYVITDASGAGGSGSGDVGSVMSGFADFLITPVLAFFSVEFIPGFSFGKIALVAFLIGLVFWFLKMSK